MPRRLASKSAVVFAACLVAISLLPAAHALAIDSTWNADADGNWSDAAKWTAGGPRNGNG